MLRYAPFLLLLVACAKNNSTDRVNSALALTTDSAGIISPTAAVGGGYVSSDGGDPITQWGVVWSSNPGPTLANSVHMAALGSVPGRFTDTLSGLTPGATYFYRAFAKNSSGIAFGQQRTLVVPGPGSWQPRSTGLPPRTIVWGLGITGRWLIAGTSAGIYVSTDTGRTWTPRMNSLTGGTYTVVSAAGANVVVGNSFGVSVSLDSGNTFTNQPLPSSAGNSIVWGIARQGNRIYTTGTNGFRVSTDQGTSFAQMTMSNWTFSGGAGVHQGALYISTQSDLYRTSDGGTTWQSIAGGLPSDIVQWAFASGPNNVLYAAGNTGVWKLASGASSWTACGSLPPNHRDAYALALYGGKLYVATGDGVLSTSDEGANWVMEANGYPANSGWLPSFTGTRSVAGSLLVVGNQLLAGTGEGVYIRDL